MAPAFSISSRQMPASLGVHGPGDSTMPFGFRAITSATAILSLRNTAALPAKLAQVVDEIVGEAVVVIDQDQHRQRLREGGAPSQDRQTHCRRLGVRTYLHTLDGSTPMTAFKTIRARAAKRKGGEAALAALLPKIAGPEGPGQAGRRPGAGRDGEAHLLGWLRVERDRAEVAGVRGGIPGISAAAASGPAGRVLGGPDSATSASSATRRRSWRCAPTPLHRSTSPGSMAASASSWPSGRPTTRSVCSTCWPSAARGSAATPGSTSCASSAGTASSCRATWSPACATPASTSPRSHLQEGSAQDSGPVQRLGARDRPTIYAPVPYLRPVDRRELRRRDVARARHGGGLIPKHGIPLGRLKMALTRLWRRTSFYGSGAAQDRS